MAASLINHMVCWTPANSTRESRGQVVVVPWPDHEHRWSDLSHSFGACNREVQRMAWGKRRTLIASTALGMILRDGLDPNDVHRALWQLEEYRDVLPKDTPAP